MVIEPLGLPDVRLLRPRRIWDSRGFFAETWRATALTLEGQPVVFVQENHSWSARRGTVRGLHFQRAPHEQHKLIQVLRGRILDVAVDIRPSSPSFGGHVSVELNADEGSQLFVPAGFAHGFQTLTDDTHVLYKVSAYYEPASDAVIRWDDPALKIQWAFGREAATLSDKDAAAPSFADYDAGRWSPSRSPA